MNEKKTPKTPNSNQNSLKNIKKGHKKYIQKRATATKIVCREQLRHPPRGPRLEKSVRYLPVVRPGGFFPFFLAVVPDGMREAIE